MRGRRCRKNPAGTTYLTVRTCAIRRIVVVYLPTLLFHSYESIVPMNSRVAPFGTTNFWTEPSARRPSPTKNGWRSLGASDPKSRLAAVEKSRLGGVLPADVGN